MCVCAFCVGGGGSNLPRRSRGSSTLERVRGLVHNYCVCVCVCGSFFLLSLFVTLYIFLHLTVMHSSTFGKGWVGMSSCPLVVLACESLHVCTVCIWRCEHARFCVEVFLRAIYKKNSFIHSYMVKIGSVGW